jgi:glycosyltransferase involved in cell wall biosynthesis/GT2 family glycosyltransferase
MMKHIAIGIYFDEGAERLRATLASVRANTSHAYDWLVLADGLLDAATQRVTSEFRISVSCSNAPAGAAACFNRLLAYNRTDVMVFLEAGCLAAPGWLDALLAALDGDPRNGLAGPSTNLVWNEQCAFPDAQGAMYAIARTAHQARREFGAAARTLGPLHSLADFCYAVKREVVEAIGAADESYRFGPCWEMDYNIRAHRAGFRGVWACASYVYRAPLSTRRQRDEQLAFEASKRLYQDKFCGLRLNGARPDYESHCRGEECEHFAPAPLLRLHLPLPEAATIGRRNDLPLVSCVMVTRDRPEFVLQSILYFERQDYPQRELIIVDDGEGLAGFVPAHERIRYVKLAGKHSIGAKRNRGCELARGIIIAQWDDDDWYAPNRLRLQVQPLLEGSAEITALQSATFFDLAGWRFWRCTEALYRRLFVQEVIGGTLVYKRSCWQAQARYPEASLAEDATFLTRAIQHGARLKRMAADGVFLYLRHAGNTWSFQCGSFLDPRGWLPVTEPSLPAEDRAFYAARSARAPAPSAEDPERPLVSCVMPTANRRTFIPQAIQYFLRQDYPNRELIVLDDGEDAVDDLIPDDPRIRYLRLPRRYSIGAKRNLACEEARGTLIAHWDDDDWMASRRISYQVGELAKAGGRSVCGLSRLYYFDPRRRRVWLYKYPDRQKPWLAGNTLCYRKDLWRQHRFPDFNEGEDTRFVWGLPQSSILPLDDYTFFVATVHEKNSSPKRTQDARWTPRTVEEIADLIGGDFSFYDEWPAMKSQADGLQRIKSG